MMPVLPHRQRATRMRMLNQGRIKGEIAHAQQAEYIASQRLYQRMRTRPREFTELEKRELRHRHRYRETRYETYMSLSGPFEQGLLNRGQFERFKHALALGEKWDDYTGYKKYATQGLESLTDAEFNKADKFAKFSFGIPTFRAYKKMRSGGLGSLSESEWTSLNEMETVTVPREEWLRATRVHEAKGRGIIEEREGQLHIIGDLADMGKSNFDLLRGIGFDLPEYANYMAYEKYKSVGLGGISEDEFKRVKTLVGFEFGVEEFRAYKKLMTEGLGSLDAQELRSVNIIGGINISEGDWIRARKTVLAKRRGLIYERAGRLHIRKSLRNLTRGDVQLLRELGFDLPPYDELRSILGYRGR